MAADAVLEVMIDVDGHRARVRLSRLNRAALAGRIPGILSATGSLERVLARIGNTAAESFWMRSQYGYRQWLVPTVPTPTGQLRGLFDDDVLWRELCDVVTAWRERAFSAHLGGQNAVLE